MAPGPYWGQGADQLSTQQTQFNNGMGDRLWCPALMAGRSGATARSSVPAAVQRRCGGGAGVVRRQSGRRRSAYGGGGPVLAPSMAYMHI
jgi:hypothetical protein